MQLRTYAPDFAHAPYAHPLWKTGRAGVPEAPSLDAGIFVTAPPLRGTEISSRSVARRTEEESGPTSWRVTEALIPSSARLRREPSGRTRTLLRVSKATGCSPTAVSTNSALADSPLMSVDLRRSSCPSRVTLIRRPARGEIAKRVPFWETVATP